MKNKIFVLSHTDLDGYFSAAIAEFFTKQNYPESTFKHQSWTYGRDLPNIGTITKCYDKVYIVDLCPDAEFMFKLYEEFGDNLIWIDHHVKPDYEFLEKFNQKYPGKKIPGVREEVEHRNSAASLCWKYYSFNNIPKWLQLIAEFDTWNRSNEPRWQNEIMPMFTYLKSKVSSVKEANEYIKQRNISGILYDEVLPIDAAEKTEKEIDEGKIMYKTIKSLYNAEAKHGFARKISVSFKSNNNFTVLNAWVCNTQERSSVIFEDMPNKDEFDVFIPYHYNGEKYFYSMYTFKSDISCNDICICSQQGILEFNGHKDAAGSNAEFCPFNGPYYKN